MADSVPSSSSTNHWEPFVAGIKDAIGLLSRLADDACYIPKSTEENQAWCNEHSKRLFGVRFINHSRHVPSSRRIGSCNVNSDGDDTAENNKAVADAPAVTEIILLDCNKFMGGIDLSAKLMSAYEEDHKCLRWHRRVFYWIFVLSESGLIFNIIPNRLQNPTVSVLWIEKLI
ncbi:hypothetical protein T01_3713 [Trichinella spiralis]|uniref:Uncharacterized protein n=1 Tax=Trichinella spiralis TaxID=6334 RepID=A0A0V1BNP9_TRISP|nr:hypothetical protein T01_3713 [Trichinella spiralis]